MLAWFGVTGVCLLVACWLLRTQWHAVHLHPMRPPTKHAQRRLFAAKGYRPTNPLCPRPPPASAPLPRLSWDDKWLLYRRTRQPGYRALLEELLVAEDALHRCGLGWMWMWVCLYCFETDGGIIRVLGKRVCVTHAAHATHATHATTTHRFKPAGSLRGTPRNLSLMVFLDSTKNAVAIREAYNRNIPTVAVANTLNDMSQARALCVLVFGLGREWVGADAELQSGGGGCSLGLGRCSVRVASLTPPVLNPAAPNPRCCCCCCCVLTSHTTTGDVPGAGARLLTQLHPLLPRLDRQGGQRGATDAGAGR